MGLVSVLVFQMKLFYSFPHEMLWIWPWIIRKHKVKVNWCHRCTLKMTFPIWIPISILILQVKISHVSVEIHICKIKWQLHLYSLSLLSAVKTKGKRSSEFTWNCYGSHKSFFFFFFFLPELLIWRKLWMLLVSRFAAKWMGLSLKEVFLLSMQKHRII